MQEAGRRLEAVRALDRRAIRTFNK